MYIYVFAYKSLDRPANISTHLSVYRSFVQFKNLNNCILYWLRMYRLMPDLLYDLSICHLIPLFQTCFSVALSLNTICNVIVCQALFKGHFYAVFFEISRLFWCPKIGTEILIACKEYKEHIGTTGKKGIKFYILYDFFFDHSIWR